MDTFICDKRGKNMQWGKYTIYSGTTSINGAGKTVQLHVNELN